MNFSSLFKSNSSKTELMSQMKQVVVKAAKGDLDGRITNIL